MPATVVRVSVQPAPAGLGPDDHEAVAILVGSRRGGFQFEGGQLSHSATPQFTPQAGSRFRSLSIGAHRLRKSYLLGILEGNDRPSQPRSG